MKIDIIVPCYNEEGNVELLYQKIEETLKDIKHSIIYINDGSKDQTIIKLKELYNKDNKTIKIINFSRNFGKDAAIYAGLKNSTAKYAVIIDADLQQNPKYILEMYNYLEKNKEYDQVAMINNKRTNDNIIVRLLKRSFYSLMNKISDIKFGENASDFRMFRSNVIESITSLPENNRFSKGIFSWVGYNTSYLEYTVEERHSGKTNFNLKKSFSYAWDGIINFSIKPLKLASIFGSLISLGSFIYLISIIIKALVKGIDVPGYPSLICVVLFLGGLNLLAIGIASEYISRMYLEIKRRPIYLAKEKIGFDDIL